MSSTGIQKLLSQTMNKKRKSCFEITRVAFQNLSEDETDDDENASKHCSNCESFLPKENLQTSREDVSARTRFKVLKAAYIRGRWNCNDSLEDEGEFYLDDVNSGKYEIGDPEHKNSLDVFQSSISVLNFSECKTSTHSRSLMAESRHTFPDLLDHQVNHSSKDIQIIQTSDFGSTDCWGTLGHSSSSPLFLMKPDITNTCEKSDESCTVRIEVHPPLNNHASEDRSSHPNINVVSRSGLFHILNTSYLKFFYYI